MNYVTMVTGEMLICPSILLTQLKLLNKLVYKKRFLFVKHVFVFNLVVFNLKHIKIKKVCVHMCVWGGGGGGEALGIHLEANGAPAWKTLGTTAIYH